MVVTLKSAVLDGACAVRETTTSAVQNGASAVLDGACAVRETTTSAVLNGASAVPQYEINGA